MLLFLNNISNTQYKGPIEMIKTAIKRARSLSNNKLIAVYFLFCALFAFSNLFISIDILPQFYLETSAIDIYKNDLKIVQINHETPVANIRKESINDIEEAESKKEYGVDEINSSTTESKQLLSMTSPSSNNEESEKHESPALARVERHLIQVEQGLERNPIRFYMYDHPNLTFHDRIEELEIQRNDLQVHRDDVDNDEQMLAALANSPLRTYNPDEADLYIPPIPIGRIFLSVKQDHRTAIETLMQQEIYRKYYGHKHVLISTVYVLFRREVKHSSNMKRLYRKIYNVTAVMSWDPSAVYNTLKTRRKGGIDWKTCTSFRKRPLVRRSASIGLGSNNKKIRLVSASWEKFNNSSNFIFYHATKDWIFFNNSTIYRHAPITNITLENFPKSSIGWDIDKAEWDLGFRDSKFCLVIKGDSPHSHALWRSIRVGCIPVILADTLPIFAPMFKSTLNMTEYAIILKEDDILINAQQTLLQLQNISEEDLKTKIKHLAFAQRVIFTDHPQSLFVPAFLKEAQMATEVRL